MLFELVRLLRDHQESYVDRLVSRIASALPAYARMEGVELRESVAGFTAELIQAVETGDAGKLTQRLIENSQSRVNQGLSLAEYMRALFLAPGVCREMLREIGPKNDPNAAKAFSALEEKLHEITALAADIYTETAARQLRAKNLELNRLNQALEAREKALQAEGVKVSRALASANEFNSRVIQSLSSGVLVVDHATRKLTLYSQRMEGIFDLPAEEVLGKEGPEAFARIKGIDHALIIKTVQATGRFPLTKLSLTSAQGRKRTVFVRAQRMYGPDGEIEGTVFVADDVTERELLIDSFSRYVSRDLVTRLLSRSGEPLGLEGERRTCTVLFADIRGFTGIAEHLPPEALHRLLNDYLHVMVESIVEQGGFIDKFVGDKVMALFTGPRSDADSAHAAIEAARAILVRIAAQNASRVGGGERPIEVGIGINTGPVVVGNVGDEARMDFTAIGDAVNVADRLQSLAKGAEILVGGMTASLVQGKVAFEDRGAQQVKGRAAPVPVHAVRPQVGG
ncbi:MAG: PAS domain-containing protein [Deltaproteobacteria bacterium]|nr:PAS domain-containing protein [Deltaproteobacteria bacterium]